MNNIVIAVSYTHLKDDLEFTKKLQICGIMKLIPTNLIEEKTIKERNEEYTIFVEYRDYFTKSFSFKTRSKKISVIIFLGILIVVALAHCISIAVLSLIHI